MADYGDHYKEAQHQAFLNEWTPDGIKPLKLTEENLRFHLAKSRAAAAELKELKDALHIVKKFM